MKQHWPERAMPLGLWLAVGAHLSVAAAAVTTTAAATAAANLRLEQLGDLIGCGTELDCCLSERTMCKRE